MTTDHKPDVSAHELLELCDRAWGIIANAGGGDWSKETADWTAAACRWRDQYHAILVKEELNKQSLENGRT